LIQMQKVEHSLRQNHLKAGSQCLHLYMDKVFKFSRLLESTRSIVQ
jgi:hypothetical protein